MERNEFYPRLQKLSPRDLEVARLIACGKSNKQIALALPKSGGGGHITTGTAKGYVQGILAKLGVESRVEVAVLWERWVSAEGAPAKRQVPNDGARVPLRSATVAVPR